MYGSCGEPCRRWPSPVLPRYPRRRPFATRLSGYAYFFTIFVGSISGPLEVCPTAEPWSRRLVNQRPTHMLLGSRVRTARELRGLTQAEAVGRMSDAITTAALSQIEAGKVRPSADTVAALAGALDVPPAYFSAHWPSSLPESPAPLAYFRDLRATPARERRRALALALLLSDLVAAIEQHVRLPPLTLSHAPIGVGGRAEIEQITQDLRDRWGLGLDPIPHLVREIERHGVPVARLSIGHRLVDGFSVRLPHRPLILLADDKINYVRSRFDAAHELGHLIMHSDSGIGDRSIERQAHIFASSLLFPEAVAVEDVPRRMDSAGWSQLAELKRKWGISMAALLRRGRDLHTLGEDEYRNAMKLMSARGWRSQEPGDRELGPPESPLLLERALRTIEVEEGLTAEELIQSAHLPLDDTLELVKSSHDKRPIVEL